jgi:LmeA-like phospholipid-binding
MRKLFVFLLVVAALLVAADRVAAYEAGQVLSQRLASAYQFSEQPTVQVQGIPFLTQWSSGKYQEIDVQAPSVTTGSVSVDNLSAQLHAVTTASFATSSADVAGATVGQVRVQGVVPYSSVPVPKGFQVAPEGNQLKLSGTASGGGVSAPITATVNVAAQDGKLQLTVDQVQLPGTLGALGLSGQVKAQINQQLQAAASSFQLPMGVRLDSASVTGDGLRVSASASGVQVPGTRSLVG